jgi:hypothetical protein
MESEGNRRSTTVQPARVVFLRRVTGSVAIVFGATVIGFSPNRDTVILAFAHGHGIHITDVLGMVFVVLGIVMLWRSPRTQSH